MLERVATWLVAIDSMKALALRLILVSAIVAVGMGLFGALDGPATASEYAEQYGGSESTYRGILTDTRCERLWELHQLDEVVQPGYRIAAADRYNAICLSGQ